jgi:hypothetical protein
MILQLSSRTQRLAYGHIAGLRKFINNLFSVVKNKTEQKPISSEFFPSLTTVGLEMESITSVVSVVELHRL